MYYSGCSTGGAQGFALAQYHPELYDGIFAGSPGNYWDHLTFGGVAAHCSLTYSFSSFMLDGTLRLIVASSALSVVLQSRQAIGLRFTVQSGRYGKAFGQHLTHQ